MGDDVWNVRRLASRCGMRESVVTAIVADLEADGITLRGWPLDRALIAIYAYAGGHRAPAISVLGQAAYLPAASWLVSAAAPGTYAAVFPTLLHATTWIADHPNGTYHLSPVGVMGLEASA